MILSKWNLFLLMFILLSACSAKKPASIDYSSNDPIYYKTKYDISICVVVEENIPAIEKKAAYRSLNKSFSNEFKDPIVKDLRKSGLFAKVIANSGKRNKADLLLIIDVKHFKAEDQLNPLFIFHPVSLGILNPTTLPMKYANCKLSLNLKLIEHSSKDVIWEDSINQEWTSDNYQRAPSDTYKVRYSLISKRIKSKMKRIIKELDSQVASISNNNESDNNKISTPNKQFLSSWRAPESTRLVSIGISNFDDTSIPQVNYADNDAQYISSFLKSSGVPQENITCLTNKEATSSDILDALSKLKMATTDNSETAIFYFSGHGAPILEDGKIVDAALMPYDATPNNIKYSGIRISNLKEMLSDTQGNWIVILDACFSGKEGRSFMDKDVKSIAVVPKDYNVSPEKTSNSYWITSTSGDNFANSFPKKEQGLFTHYFVKALNGEKGVDRNKDGLITLEEAFAWTKNKVSSVSKKSLGKPQYPELTGEGNMILTMPQ